MSHELFGYDDNEKWRDEYYKLICKKLNEAGILYNDNGTLREWDPDEVGYVFTFIVMNEQAYEFLYDNNLIDTERCVWCGKKIEGSHVMQTVLEKEGDLEGYHWCMECEESKRKMRQSIYSDMYSQNESHKSSEKQSTINSKKKDQKQNTSGGTNWFFVLVTIVGWIIAVMSVYNTTSVYGDDVMTNGSWIASVVITFIFGYALSKVVAN